MKKIKMAVAMVLVMGAVVSVLSACGQTGNPEETQANGTDGVAEISDSADEAQEAQNGEMTDPVHHNSTESEGEGYMTTAKEDVLESLTGEYDYLSEDGTGRLSIKKTSDGYDISDYESESSWRFLADLSNIEAMENNKIYIKYPEQVFSDGTTVFGYYILEHGTDEINVYYGKSTFEETEFLYRATKTAQAAGNADLETTVEELLDSFIDGSISAVDSADLTSTFYITDLNMDSEGWDAYSIGEKVDLDNDGENELIICGPYGGMYLDAHDGRVYKFAAGEGTALILSYTYYNGDVWIMYSNMSSAGFEFYHIEKFEGADNLVAEMNFGEEFDIYHAEEEDGVKYTLNGNEISYDEYTALCSKIFAAEVSTN